MDDDMMDKEPAAGTEPGTHEPTMPGPEMPHEHTEGEEHSADAPATEDPQ